MHFCLICIYSIKYLISGKCDLDPVAKPQQASNHTIVLVRVKPSKICHIAHVLMKFEMTMLMKRKMMMMMTGTGMMRWEDS